MFINNKDMASNSEYEQRRSFEKSNFRWIDFNLLKAELDLINSNSFDKEQQFYEEYNRAVLKAQEDFINNKI